MRFFRSFAWIDGLRLYSTAMPLPTLSLARCSTAHTHSHRCDAKDLKRRVDNATSVRLVVGSERAFLQQQRPGRAHRSPKSARGKTLNRESIKRFLFGRGYKLPAFMSHVMAMRAFLARARVNQRIVSDSIKSI